MTWLKQGCDVAHTPQLDGRIWITSSALTQRITPESTSVI